MHLPAQPLIRGDQKERNTPSLIVLFGAWLVTIAWLSWNHVLWRDEVRAFSLALSGSNLIEMLHYVHGEGHPALWYLILRSTHDVFPDPQILPIVAVGFGIAAMAVVTFLSPFRRIIIALILFSLFGAFEYVVVARNYGISALGMLALAALYHRVKGNLWFGFILVIICNTSVPSCLLAAAFLVYRFVEMLVNEPKYKRRDWQIFLANGFLASGGALLCFLTVYPTFNEIAVSSNFHELSAVQVAAALVDGHQGFSNLGLLWEPLTPIVLALSCLAFARKPAALSAAFSGLFWLKLFFYFVYPSYYRHEALFIIFLLCLHWMTAKSPELSIRPNELLDAIQFVGMCAFIQLLVLQSGLLSTRIYQRVTNVPYSRSAEVAQLLKSAQLDRAIVMADPDTMLEALPYYADNPLWFLREQRFGKVVRLTRNARQHISLDDVIADARRLNTASGRRVVFLSHMILRDRYETRISMFDDTTSVTPASYTRFMASTRLIARLRPAGTDESYDVYVFPR
jgi:hypothetical protein